MATHNAVCAPRVALMYSASNMPPILSATLSDVKRAALHHIVSGAPSNQLMRTVEEVRRARLQLLLEKHGSWAKLNELTGKKKLDSTYSQIAGQAIGSRSGSPKQMGSALARQLEDALGLPRALMDTDPDLLEGNTALTACGADTSPPTPAEALEVLGAELAAVPPEMREAVAINLAGWARDGGRGPWRAVVQQLLTTPPGKRTGTSG